MKILTAVRSPSSASRFATVGLLLLVACGTAKVDIQLGDEMDSDEDGLSDAGEIDEGTDPTSDDSDGDTWSDGEEFEQGTDPLSELDHPYTGGWKIDKECRNMAPDTTGANEGDIAANFTLVDQYGDNVRLYDFCNHAVLLISAAFW